MDMTLRATKQNTCKTLGLSELALETVRLRLAQAARLMRDGAQGKYSFPTNGDEREALNELLTECVTARLEASGVKIKKDESEAVFLKTSCG
jgi:hypothetical protein